MVTAIVKNHSSKNFVFVQCVSEKLSISSKKENYYF